MSVAATYVDLGKLKGYIIDPAYMIFKRKSDSKMFLMQNANSASVSSTVENIQIMNGWINSPQAVIDTSASDTISYTTQLFDLWLLAGISGRAMATTSSKVVDHADQYAIETGTKITMSGVTATVTQIEGFTLKTDAGNPATGEYSVTNTPAEGTTPAKTEIQFCAGDIPDGDIVQVFYTTTESNVKGFTFPSTMSLPTGSLTRVTPVYAESTTSSSIMGWVYDVFPNVKVTGIPGFDASFKSESSHTVEFVTLASASANATRREMFIIAA